MKATNNIEKKLKEYLNRYLPLQNLLSELEESSLENSNERCISQKICGSAISKTNINNYIENELDKNNFQTKLFQLIDTSGKTDSEIYNKANIDRRLFSKIRSNSNYHPSKNTVISLGLALNLEIDKFEELLKSASYSLPKNNYFDLIIRFCINEKIYNIIDVNNYLSQYNCNILN